MKKRSQPENYTILIPMWWKYSDYSEYKTTGTTLTPAWENNARAEVKTILNIAKDIFMMKNYNQKRFSEHEWVDEWTESMTGQKSTTELSLITSQQKHSNRIHIGYTLKSGATKEWMGVSIPKEAFVDETLMYKYPNAALFKEPGYQWQDPDTLERVFVSQPTDQLIADRNRIIQDMRPGDVERLVTYLIEQVDELHKDGITISVDGNEQVATASSVPNFGLIYQRDPAGAYRVFPAFKGLHK